MKALITGASSGIGYKMAHVLSDMGYDIIAVARRKDKLEQLKNQLKTNVEIVVCDVSDQVQCKELVKYADEVEILINNAGFGVFGDFCSTDLENELKMIETNVKAVHILTKQFVKSFKNKNHGYILNVSSLAAFFPGPLFSAYYASKSYVLRLSQAINEELKQSKSNVHISVLCPGPVHTEFSEVAKVNFGSGTEKMGNMIVLESDKVAKYAIKMLFKKKAVIVPGFIMKIAVFMRHILPDSLLAKAAYKIQSNKCVID